MKKRLIFIVSLFCLVLTARAQTYYFNVLSGTYSDLVGSTSLNNGMTWDDPNYVIPVAFNFQIFETTVNQVFLGSFEGIFYYSVDTSQTGTMPLAIPYGPDIVDRGYNFNIDEPTPGALSEISYLLEGVVGNRILKTQWKNVGFYYEIMDDHISTDYMNFQVWLYEGTGDFEVHFGPNSITNPDESYNGFAGPLVGLLHDYDFSLDTFGQKSIGLVGTPSAPNLVPLDINTVSVVNGNVPDGTIYKFRLAPVGESEYQSGLGKIDLFPNPSNDFVNVVANNQEISISSISIFNTRGQKVKEVDASNLTIDISDLNSGIYLVQLTSALGVETKKLIKR